jgi:hypothetical protein
MYLYEDDFAGIGNLRPLAGGLGVVSMGAVDWDAVKAAKYFDPKTDSEKPITDVEISAWMGASNITRKFAENRMNTNMVIQNVRGHMLGGKTVAIDPKLIARTEKGWWETFWSDYKRRMGESFAKFKWPMIGVGTILLGAVVYGVYRRVAGPSRKGE